MRRKGAAWATAHRSLPLIERFSAERQKFCVAFPLNHPASTVTPNDGLDRWSVSQAAPYRRMHVRGNLALSDGGWSSGGFLADSKVDGQVQPYSQQQWLTRNSQIGGNLNGVWNQVFSGVVGAPAADFPTNP